MTFDFIKSHCVPGETVFIRNTGTELTYMGFNKNGHIDVISIEFEGQYFYTEEEIKNWKIKKDD